MNINSRSELNSRILSRMETELRTLHRGQEEFNLRLGQLSQSVQELRELQRESQLPTLASWSTLPDRIEEIEQQLRRMDHRVRETSVLVAKTVRPETVSVTPKPESKPEPPKSESKPEPPKPEPPKPESKPVVAVDSKNT
jgi:hypothetical protein